ncbi:hypothetical protein KUTeg_018942 [Tegillarca granosa]|uniref:SCP domain-containing protein n=1 Tax=Tegillarca granosa TaxID=220873 RepID=A0ABQ9EFB4_TEGGR|nr:hypothetical protein KUTeg_018942 [Tegillarca granosa]
MIHANGEDSQSSENDKRITVTFSTITSPDQFQRQMKIAHNNIRANEAVETQASDMTKMVVWAESKFLGCALKFCPKLEIPKTGKTWYNAYLAVCEYGPGGNKNNVKPYRKGGVCATCPGECIDNKLCRKYYTEADLARRAMDTDNGNELKDETRGLLERLEELIEREIPEVATTPSPNGGEETEIVL